MKNIFKVLAALTFCAVLAPGCVPVPPSGSPSVAPTQQPAEKTGTDAYGNGFNANYLCGVDGLGRSFMPVSGMDESKDVGMFYFLWHGTSGKNTFNNTEQLATDPDGFWDTTTEQNLFHYWGEPLYGYYNSWDKWVVGRHIEMLTHAGVDFLVFDTTNAEIYQRAFSAVLNMLEEYQQQGWNVPKIAFYTNSYSIRTMNKINEALYQKGKWKSLWYCPDGEHPLIIGALTEEQDRSVIGDPNYYPGELSEEFKAFFDLRDTQWPFDPFKNEAFPWMEWTYPQPSHNGVMNVSVAQHPQLPFNASITDRTRNWGRGYDYETKTNVEADMQKGTNFQSQWNTAINSDETHTVFVTGWNEWIAQKLIIDGSVWYVDCATEEFSRDLEPMRGGYEDAYYLQLCDNIRRFKGQQQEIMASDKATIDINGDASQWDGIRNTYKAASQSAAERDETSVDKKYEYKLPAAVNNIQEVKVTSDSDSVYFLIRCENDIVVSDAPNFMNILIGTGVTAAGGWEGYDYIFAQNKVRSYADNSENPAESKVSGKFMQVKIPMSALNVAQSDTGIYFKVADGVANTEDIMEYYVSGKSLPMGRLSYYYYFN